MLRRFFGEGIGHGLIASLNRFLPALHNPIDELVCRASGIAGRTAVVIICREGIGPASQQITVPS
jgi:hypothetical protein